MSLKLIVWQDLGSVLGSVAGSEVGSEVGSELGFAYDDDGWQHWTYGDKNMARHTPDFKQRAEDLWQSLIQDLAVCSASRLTHLAQLAQAMHVAGGFGNVASEQ